MIFIKNSGSGKINEKLALIPQFDLIRFYDAIMPSSVF